jgi:hypothetical protein
MCQLKLRSENNRDIASASDQGKVNPYRTYTAHTASVEVRQMFEPCLTVIYSPGLKK